MLFNQTQYGIKQTSMSASVPNHPLAKLMYYFKSVCSLLPIDQDGDLRHLQDYDNYRFLDREEIDLLMKITALVNPKVLLNKCIFVAPELCGNSNNKFFELQEVNNILGVSDNIVIGGQNKEVTSIMACNERWLQNNFYEPLGRILQMRKEQEEARQRSIRINQIRVINSEEDCSIM